MPYGSAVSGDETYGETGTGGGATTATASGQTLALQSPGATGTTARTVSATGQALGLENPGAMAATTRTASADGQAVTLDSPGARRLVPSVQITETHVDVGDWRLYQTATGDWQAIHIARGDLS